MTTPERKRAKAVRPPHLEEVVHALDEDLVRGREGRGLKKEDVDRALILQRNDVLAIGGQGLTKSGDRGLDRVTENIGDEAEVEIETGLEKRDVLAEEVEVKKGTKPRKRDIRGPEVDPRGERIGSKFLKNPKTNRRLVKSNPSQRDRNFPLKT